jgi:hypothetical protein
MRIVSVRRSACSGEMMKEEKDVAESAHGTTSAVQGNLTHQRPRCSTSHRQPYPHDT